MSGRRLSAAYALGVAVPAALAVVLLVTTVGRQAGTDTRVAPVRTSASGFDINHILLVVAVVIVAAHAAGALAARIGQPRVVGQAAAGLLLGPSMLGSLFPGWLSRDGAGPVVEVLAQLGIVLFVFMIGRELAASGQSDGGRSMLIGQVMIAVPVLGGIVVAVLLLEPPAGVDPVAFTLFIGLAMGATALPVLAHLLAERRQLTSPVGGLAVRSAVVGDATVWALLAVVMTLLRGGSLATMAVRLAGALLFSAAVWWVVRPLLRRLLPPDRDSRYAGPALILAGVLAAAVTTEVLGLHAIFGAFLAGLAVPARSLTVERVTVTASGAAEWLLLPLFFTVVGMRTDLRLLTDPAVIPLCLVILVVAVAGKLAAGFVAGRITGLARRDAVILGVLLNCRGLTELVLLNAGRQAGVIDDRTFTVFVVMALVTTAITGPLLTRLGMGRPPAPVRQAIEEPAADRA
jgi:Kef-type K+ transport system membrane component KefB